MFRRALCNFYPKKLFIRYQTVQFANCSSDVPSAPVKLKNDPILLALKAARSTPDALKIIGIHADHMDQEQIINSLRLLTNLQKLSNAGFTELDVMKSQEFSLLCRRLKKHLRTLEINELFDTLKALTMFKVRHNSGITMSVLHLIKNDINSLSITQLTFLAFLLRQYPSEPLVDALIIAIPIVVDAQLRTKLDRTNVAALVDTLIFCSKSQMSADTCDYVVKALYDLDQLDWMTMDPKRARSIALAITDLCKNSPIYEKVFKDAVDVFLPNIGQFTFSDIDVLVASSLKSAKKCPYFYYLPLFEALGDVALANKWNSVEMSIALRKLSSVGVVNKKLLDEMTEKILEEPEAFQEAKFGMIKSYVAGLSVANYKTNHWNLLKDLLPVSKCFENISAHQPWVPLCLDLASLDIFCDKLLAQVFDDRFLRKYLAREYNLLDLLQLQRLHQTVTILHPSYEGPFASEVFLKQAEELNVAHVGDLPLRGALEEAMGRDRVLTRCMTEHGILLDYVVLIPSDDNPVPLPEKNENIVLIDKLPLPEDCQKVAVRFLTENSYNSLKQLRGHSLLKNRTIEASGFSVVTISSELWRETPDWEKIPYLGQQIRLKYKTSATIQTNSVRLIPPEMYDILAISTETVEDLFGRDMLGRVSIVDKSGAIIYDRYVRPVEQVRCYRTAVTGLRREHLLQGSEFDVVQAEVVQIIRHAIVVGHSLQRQFAVLKITHPVELVRDVAVFPGGKKLSFLCQLYLDKMLQKHNSVGAADACMQLYWKFIHQ